MRATASRPHDGANEDRARILVEAHLRSSGHGGEQDLGTASAARTREYDPRGQPHDLLRAVGPRDGRELSTIGVVNEDRSEVAGARAVYDGRGEARATGLPRRGRHGHRRYRLDTQEHLR